jgi:tetratricopeptide (TPR) repeat protein
MMDKRKPTSTTKSIRTSETTDFVIIGQAQLALISPKRVATKQRVNATKEATYIKSNKSIRVDSRITKNKLELSLTSSENSTGTAAKSSSRPIRTDSNIVEAQLRLPAISSNVTTTKHVSVTSSDTEQSTIPSENQAETSSPLERSIGPSQVRIIRHFTLVWLDSNVVKSNTDSKYSINQFYEIMDEIKLSANSDECIDYFRKEIDQTVFLIISNDLAQSTISHIHDMSQLDSIYILCENMPKQKRMAEQWSKVKGVFTSIDSIYEIIKNETQTCRRGSITISDTNVDLNRLDLSFMYTKLLKEILLDMTYADKAKKEFIEFCRQKYDVNKSDGCQKIIDEFEQDYDTYTPIWWYTRDCFLYPLVNQAFRLQEINVIIKIGFFIQDVHKRIEQLHIQPTTERTFYRGQGLLYADFSQLYKMQGGLFSFNSFLSTTTDKETGLFYADCARENPELMGILFKMIVPPTAVTSTRFASLDKESCLLEAEKEVLFTMHTIFRIGEIKLIGHRLWQVQLSLTNDNDEDLRNLTDYIRQATEGVTGWDRLGKLLLKLGDFDKAEEVFQVIIDNRTESDMEKCGHSYHMMGIVKKYKNDYKEALTYFYKALEIYQNFPDSNHLDLATIYNDIGLIFKHTGNCSKALEYYRKTLQIQSQLKFVNNSDLAITYSNIAEVHKTMEQYSEALPFYQDVLNIHKKSIPLNFPNLFTTYRNIAEMNYTMQDYPKALELFRKVLRIQRSYLSGNDTDTASIYNNIAQTHEKIGDHSEALKYYENARRILLKSRPINVSKLAIINNSIARLHKNMKEFPKALEFYQETLRLLERYPQLKQPDLATTHDNIGQMHRSVNEYEEAQLSFRRAINIVKQRTPQNYAQRQLYQEHLVEVSKRLL